MSGGIREDDDQREVKRRRKGPDSFWRLVGILGIGQPIVDREKMYGGDPRNDPYPARLRSESPRSQVIPMTGANHRRAELVRLGWLGFVLGAVMHILAVTFALVSSIGETVLFFASTRANLFEMRAPFARAGDRGAGSIGGRRTGCLTAAARRAETRRRLDSGERGW